MMKNAFCFTLKTLFVLKVFNFCVDILAMQKSSLITKIRLVFKVYGFTTWLTTIAMRILHTISKNKENQTMKFGQFIEYNMEKFFLENSYTKCGGETIF